MAQQNNLEQAKQGNPKAIAALINRTLQKRGITATVDLNNGCLNVMLDAPQLPDESVAEFIRKGVINLENESIYETHVYGRIAGEHFSTWVQEFEFKQRPAKSTLQPDQSISGGSRGMNQVAPVPVPQSTNKNMTISISTENGIRNVDLVQLLGVVGAFILLVGVFTPIVNIPVVGTLNYFKDGTQEGVILAGLAITSLLLSITRRYSWLWVTGSCSLALVTLSFIILQTHISETKSQLNDDLSSNPFGGLANLAMQSVQLQWGWVLLFVGSALIMAVAYLKQEKPTRQNYIAIGAILAGILALNLITEVFQQVEYTSQATKAKQSEAKVQVGSINRGQQAYYLENEVFASSIEDIGLSITPETENYSYKISLLEKEKTLVTATAKKDGLTSYTGGVFLVTGTNEELTTETIICQSDRATKTPPAAPALESNNPKCSSGSTDPTLDLKE